MGPTGECHGCEGAQCVCVCVEWEEEDTSCLSRPKKNECEWLGENVMEAQSYRRNETRGREDTGPDDHTEDESGCCSHTDAFGVRL